MLLYCVMINKHIYQKKIRAFSVGVLTKNRDTEKIKNNPEIEKERK